MSKMKVTEFEILDHGVDGAQYFQGCGVAFTNYSDAATGCGQSVSEAFDDALEQIASDGVDVSPIEQSEPGKVFAADKRDRVAETLAKHGEKLDENEDCELYCYVSIRFNKAGKESAS